MMDNKKFWEELIQDVESMSNDEFAVLAADCKQISDVPLLCHENERVFPLEI